MYRGDYKYYPLHKAILEENIEQFNHILSDENLLEQRDIDGQTPLLAAIELGREEMGLALIEKDANIEAKDKRGNTPLMVAVIKSQAMIVRALLEKGADYRERYQEETLLSLAVEREAIEVITALLERAKKDKQELAYFDRNKEHLLHRAIEVNALEVMEALLEGGVDIDAKGVYGDTGLHIGARYVKEEAIRRLLARGADSGVVNNHGQTAEELAKQLRYSSRIIQDLEEFREQRQKPSAKRSITKSKLAEQRLALSDEEWEKIKPYVEQAGKGRPNEIDKRLIAEAIRYVLITSCTWRNIPDRYPRWKTVYDYYWQWKQRKEWKVIVKILKQGKRRRRKPAS